jgi:hypothetical protein
LEGKNLHVQVKSGIDKSHIQGEMLRLLDALRQKLHDQHLRIQVDIDENIAAETKIQAPPKPLNAREKWDKMVEINPVLGDLKDRFDLELDNS